jgi:hypothetical protein
MVNTIGSSSATRTMRGVEEEDDPAELTPPNLTAPAPDIRRSLNYQEIPYAPSPFMERGKGVRSCKG